MTTSKDSLNRLDTPTAQSLLRCYLEQGLMLLQQLETALAVDPSMDSSTSMKSEKSQKKDLELLLLQLELTQILKRFLPLMQETHSQLCSMTYEKEP